MKNTTLLLFSLVFCSTWMFGQENEWTLSKNGEQGLSVNSLMVRNDTPKTFKIYNLKLNSFKRKVSQAKSQKPNIVAIPTSDGIKNFEIQETSNFSKKLAEKFPNIKSYTGYQVDNPSVKVKFSKGVDGYHFSLYELGKPTYYLDSYTKDNKMLIAYSRAELSKNAQDFVCEIEKIKGKDISYSERKVNDGLLRTYKIAIVTTGEYSQFHLSRLGIATGASEDDKKEAVLSAVNTTMNRVNGIYERDLSVRMELIADNDKLIYLDSISDGLTNSVDTILKRETQELLDLEIGDANYDIGHAFSAGRNAGVAGLGVVCVTSQKGSGITGSVSPFGDSFDVDYVSHEIGHQFGANHTQNNIDCNRYSPTAVEPGSGSTIMGYAGICPPNVQRNSDDYFHSVNLAEMSNTIRYSATCATTTPTGSTAPTADAGSDYSIPKSTPFVLKGVGSDIDVSTLTYTWEQIDAEVAFSGLPIATNTSGAMFRSLPPTISPNRYMPALDTVVGNLTPKWEVLPSVEREMDFSLTVRDNDTGGGSFARDDVRIFVVDALPFTVSSQNTATSWDVDSSQTITWEVGDTNIMPINCQKVTIKLSLDGGKTFSTTLASGIINNGSHTVIVPNHVTSSARIMVEAADNIFYDVNDVNFTINSTEPTFIVSNLSGTGDVCNIDSDSFTYELNIDFLNGFSEEVSFSAAGAPSGANVVFTPNTASSDATVMMEVSNLNGATAQDYDIEVTAASASITKKINLDFIVYSNAFEVLTLASPLNNAIDVSLTPTLNWNAIANAASYDIQIATDPAFANLVSSGSSASTSFTPSETLNDITTYYWRVKAKNSCGEGDYSDSFSFTTITCIACNSVADTSFETSTTLVQFNTIDNASAKPSGYSDYTGISTNVVKEASYDLTVHANTDGNFTTRTTVWIDWNQNCSFADAGEEYFLGIAKNTANGPTANSPLSILIPSTAILGNTVMRVTTKFAVEGFPEACENGADAEVEDYAIVVEDNTAAVEDIAFDGFSLYPNPSKGNFNLQFDVIATDKVAVQLFDIRGRLIGEKKFYDTAATFSEVISFDNAAAGLYLLKVTNGDIQTTRKVIIE